MPDNIDFVKIDNGFFGSRPFSKTNQFLIEKGLSPIRWELE